MRRENIFFLDAPYALKIFLLFIFHYQKSDYFENFL